jgi:hypothetical protein
MTRQTARRLRRHQAGLALPVILVILAVMLVGSVYLLRSVNSAALTASNLAYDATLGRAADLGLHTAFTFLQQTARNNKIALDQNDANNGYVASWDGSQPADSAFWIGKKTMAGDDGTRIEYVIHRLCQAAGTYNGNQCVQTSATPTTTGSGAALGTSMAADAPVYNGQAQLHYVIAARILGGRGANVTNQMIVLIGA